MTASSVLITGGAGFIGSEYVRQCVTSNAYSKIYVIDSLTYAADINRIKAALDNSEVEFINCSISEVDKYQNLLSSVGHIVHFAAESHEDRSNADEMPCHRANTTGT